ncbi:hypothetical protein AAG570_006489 [Ranatra chinensis]|uniref:DUF1736 domain-containing protein n=1 Tax=Ranatra chinensis TaxID=642074 RepID=A0ABD0YUS9_9HEMI
MGLQPPTFASSDNPAARSPSLLTRSLTFAYLPVFNAFLLVCPRWLSFDWSMDAIPRITGPLDWRNLASAAFYWGGYRAVKLGLGGDRGQLHSRLCAIANNNNLCRPPPPLQRALPRAPLALSIAMIVLPFLPATNLFFYVGFVVAERVLYLPSVGYCILVALGYSELARRLRNVAALRAALVLLLVVYSARTYTRNMDWHDEESLYRAGLHINPPKGKLIYTSLILKYIRFFLMPPQTVASFFSEHIGGIRFLQPSAK